MHKIRQLVVSQPFLSRREPLQMNTQVMEPDSVVDLIPQIVNLKKILVPIQLRPVRRAANGGTFDVKMHSR
jgi:hypothetical protein